MTIRVECLVLLREGWRPDLEALATEFERRYPALGRVRGRKAEPESGTPDVLLIDGATVSLSTVAAPYPAEGLQPPVRLVDHVDTDGAGRAHVSYVMIGAESAEGGLEWAQAYSALVTLTAAAVAAAAPAIAVFWTESWALRTPAQIEAAAERIMGGATPRSLWVSFAEVRSSKVKGVDMRGMMSFGMRAFCGREIELAPAPASAATALALSQQVAARVLSGETLDDRTEILLPNLERPAMLRLADRFMRPRQAVLLIVPPDSSIDPETLESRTAAKQGGGLVSRLFGRG